jgi:hypothetical protein
VLWIVADVAATHGDGARRTNLIARFPFAPLLPAAALMSAGDVHLGDNVRFGLDAASEPGCPYAPSPNVILGPGAELHTTGAEPTIELRPASADSMRYLLGLNVADLRPNPHVTYVAGDTTLQGGSGQGVLVATGRIRITGTFVFSGLVIAGRGIEATAGGTAIRGAVVAFGQPGSIAVNLAGARLDYAPCIALRALRFAHAPRAVRERSWAELY